MFTIQTIHSPENIVWSKSTSPFLPYYLQMNWFILDWMYPILIWPEQSMNTMQILHPSFTMIPSPLPSALHQLVLTRTSIPSLISVRDPIFRCKRTKTVYETNRFRFSLFLHKFSLSVSKGSELNVTLRKYCETVNEREQIQPPLISTIMR